MPSAPFRTYAGYVTVGPDSGRALFYWLVEAARPDAASAPLTLWLNGGPGCSSVGGGMLSELGPFFPNADGRTLQVNAYSWNTVSNMLFLESPAGVGFSYSNSSDDYVTGDEQTASDAYTFLLGFFDKYPEYKANDFFIAGESYGGHYVPQLADKILTENEKDGAMQINLQGFAVGNAWTDAFIDNHGALFYWWTHAIISDRTFHGVKDNCNFSEIGPLSKHNDKCDEFVRTAFQEMGFINIYDIYVDMCLPSHAKQEAEQFTQQIGQIGAGRLAARPLSVPYDPCLDNEVEEYLNRRDVQEALHVHDSPRKWADCTDEIEYSRRDLLSSVLPLYPRLLESNLRILVYSGDVDAIVPVTGTRTWIRMLDLQEKRSWRPWYERSQVGGYVVEYEGLTFATVRESGHFVPYTQPARALHLFKAFINDISL
eukprot:SM000023S07714  [mRNA]  locus=s23:1018730:1022593:- [translate_table: standard]